MNDLHIPPMPGSPRPPPHGLPASSSGDLTIAEAVSKGLTATAFADKLDVSMVIGAGDTIEGRIITAEGKSLIINGAVNGEIICQGRVLIMTGAKVTGTIRAAALWVEGDVGEMDSPAVVDVGDLHVGQGSRLIADCTFDTVGVVNPNRGIRGRMTPRADETGSHG